MLECCKNQNNKPLFERGIFRQAYSDHKLVCGKLLRMDDLQKAALEFPCQFSMRIIGDDHEDFLDFVLQIAVKHIPELDEKTARTQPSSGGKYLSVYFPFTAQSREQLNALQSELSSHKRVRFIL